MTVEDDNKISEFQFEQKIINDETVTIGHSLLTDCYFRIIRILREYIDVKDDQYKFISNWIIGTYFHDNFNTFPYLFFNAMRGSGKTRTLKLISALGKQGDGSVQNNLTEAVLFRIIPGTTTCIDEVEQIGNKEKQTLRELLNSAYKKGMKVKRMKKVKVNGQEVQQVEVFEPYFPIAMANIWGMEEVLGDRAVTIVLEKSDNPSITKMIEDFDTNPEILDIKRTLLKASVVCAVSLRKKNIERRWNQYIKMKHNDIKTYTPITTYNNITTQNNNKEEERLSILEEQDLLEFFNKIDEIGISGRNFELLLPLLLTAKQISNEVFEEILKIGIDIMTEKKEDEYNDSKDVSLIDFISRLDDYAFQLISVKELTSRFRGFLGDSQDEDRWLNEKWTGKALKRLQLITYKKREHTGRFVILDISKAKVKIKMFKREDKE